MLRDEARSWLQQALDDPAADFRDGQWEAIEEVVERRGRLLVVQRTGWGKSLVYFLATRLLRDRGHGFTVLVSPLLALMRNQLQAAARLGLSAVTINSSNPQEWPEVAAQIREDRIDLLMISPERLANEGFVSRVLLPAASRVGALVIDEAHCISDWGHDFRPDYRRIVGILKHLPANAPVLCTTATATQRVITDLSAQLGDLKTQRGPLARLSLGLQALRLEEPSARLAWLAHHLNDLPGSGIIYALTQPDTEMLAGWLQEQGHAVQAYHAGLNSQTRIDLEQALLGNQVKALAATTALSMGFDKPDLGFVVHFQAPPSVVHYYQQVGRAGRALDQALGILLSGPEELQIAEYFRRTAFPRPEWVASILEELEASEDGLTLREILRAVNLRSGQVQQVLKTLAVEDPPPLVLDQGTWKRTIHRYVVDEARIARLCVQRREEADEVQALVSSPTCLMERLQRSLEDPTASPCGRCAVCRGGPLVAATFSAELEAAARTFLNLNDLPLAPRKRWEAELPEQGWGPGAIPKQLLSQEGRILCRWGQGDGALVRQGKLEGAFSKRLVHAAAALVNRWKPDPTPGWVTCVPSLRRPLLVAQFARLLAEMLGWPFEEAVRKVRETEPQKTRENSAFQCANLDGAFEVNRAAVHPTPVLLVDDVVDSRWTLTVTGALLREAGAGPVYPLALASSAPRGET